MINFLNCFHENLSLFYAVNMLDKQSEPKMGKIVQLGWTRPISFLEDLRVRDPSTDETRSRPDHEMLEIKSQYMT